MPNLVLTNGARLYVDHAHPEYSSPEVLTPREGIVWDRAGEVVMARAVDRLAAAPPGINLYKNNTDGKGASYGTHENFLLDRAVEFSDVVAALVPALVLGLVLSLILLGGDDSDDLCLPGSQQPGITIDPDSVPDTPIAGYNHEQLVNAAWIMQAANALGLSARDQTIGVMTAIGESTLNNINRGDAVGPDSRGLFQQRDNGAWGTLEERIDGVIAARELVPATARQIATAANTSSDTTCSSRVPVPVSRLP